MAVASVAGLTGVPARSGYCASKHALIGFCDSLRIELADRNLVGVNKRIDGHSFLQQLGDNLAIGD